MSDSNSRIRSQLKISSRVAGFTRNDTPSTVIGISIMENKMTRFCSRRRKYMFGKVEVILNTELLSSGIYLELIQNFGGEIRLIGFLASSHHRPRGGSFKIEILG
jgi:hypothetical protein